MPVEIRDLKAFVMLGELLHFRHAAERMHVTQSALSKQIQRLEASLGAALFERGQGATRLTPFGRLLLGDARAIVERAALLKQRAGLAAQGMLGTLRIGFGVASQTIAPLTIAAFRAVRPDVQIELHEMSTRHQLDAMRDGTLDVGFCRLPAPDGWPALPLLKESLVVAAPQHQDSGGLADLARRYPLVLLARTQAPAFHDHVLHYLAVSAIPIGSVQTVKDFSAALALVAAGIGWAIVPSSTLQMRPELQQLQLDAPLRDWTIGLVSPPGTSDPLVLEFVDNVVTLATVNQDGVFIGA